MPTTIDPAHLVRLLTQRQVPVRAAASLLRLAFRDRSTIYKFIFEQNTVRAAVVPHVPGRQEQASHVVPGRSHWSQLMQIPEPS